LDFNPERRTQDEQSDIVYEVAMRGVPRQYRACAVTFAAIWGYEFWRRLCSASQARSIAAAHRAIP